mgnify:CR=1 FL=1
MIKLLGTAMIVLGSGSAGFGFARAVRAQLRQLNALLAALEAMKGEIEYRLTPLPELFAALGEGTEPVTAAFFREVYVPEVLDDELSCLSEHLRGYFDEERYADDLLMSDFCEFYGICTGNTYIYR